MPLTGQPPTFTRGYDYQQHSIDQPTVPQPGDKLNQDFDDLATAVNEGNSAIQDITNPDGTLKDGIVTKAKIDPATWTELVDDASEDLQPYVDAAQAAAAAAAVSADAADTSAIDAEAAAQDASSWAQSTAQVANTALAAEATALGAAADAKMFADRAENSEGTAEAHMVNAGSASDQSFKWAEYLAGPVEPAPPGWPEAIDDGMWSSKWWAVRARQIVGAWGGFYLGAYPDPPFMDVNNPWPPGSLYFDTEDGSMYVWNGSQWVNFSNMPAPSVALSFIYSAVEGQQDFNGPDLQGLTPALDPIKVQPSDVHVNGVRLALDNFGGGDFTVDVATSTLHINQPLPGGSIVQWDQWLAPSQLAPGSVVAYKLLDMDRDPVTNDPGEFDGVRTTFPMRYVSQTNGAITPCAPGDGVQLQVSLDGVMQEFGIDFSTAGSDMVFADPPPAGSKVWSVWYQPGTPAP
jgi:hypothetical protein